MSKKEIINKLLSGESIKGYKEGGNSMTPLIKHRQPVNLDPVDTSKLEKGDMVLVKVRGRIYTHKVIGLKKNQVQIGNNHGGVNGWTKLDNVYGIVTEVDGRVITSALSKVRREIEVVAEELVGLAFEEAVELAENHDMIVRIEMLDGEPMTVTMDLRDNRINVVVEQGVVTEIISVGC